MVILIWIGCIFAAAFFGTILSEFLGNIALFVAELIAFAVAPILCRKYKESRSQNKVDAQEENDDNKNIDIAEEQVIEAPPATKENVISSDSMICPSCGKKLPSDSKYCQYCGVKSEKENKEDKLKEEADLEKLLEKQKIYNNAKGLLKTGTHSSEFKSVAKQCNMTVEQFELYCKNTIKEYEKLHRDYNLTHTNPAPFFSNNNM